MNGYKTRRYAHMAYVWRCSSIAWRCELPRKALPRDWMKALTLALHQSVHVQPGQRSGSARPPELQGFELVQGLEHQARVVRCIAGNLLQAFGSGSSLATAGGGEGVSLPRSSYPGWARPPCSTSTRPRNRWPIRGRLRPPPSEPVASEASLSSVQRIGGGDPPLGSHPSNPQKARERRPDRLAGDPSLDDPFLEGGL